jgi:hypothetical protein
LHCSNFLSMVNWIRKSTLKETTTIFGTTTSMLCCLSVDVSSILIRPTDPHCTHPLTVYLPSQ